MLSSEVLLHLDTFLSSDIEELGYGNDVRKWHSFRRELSKDIFWSGWSIYDLFPLPFLEPIQDYVIVIRFEH